MLFESPVPHVRHLVYNSACSTTGLERPLLKIATAEYDRMNDDKVAAALVSLGGEATGGGGENDATISVIVEGGHA